jgi:HD-GYP domain-containing protein (c-di-GMP phosphodiesterase class II)
MNERNGRGVGYAGLARDRAIQALADALDLVGVDSVGHGYRVALMAGFCAEALGWTAPARRHVVRGGLLHDCGVSTTTEHRCLVSELDWAGSETHCMVGAGTLGGMPALADLAPLVRDHHTHWCCLSNRDVVPEAAMPANLIYLVDRVDALRAAGQSPAEALATVRAHAGDVFHPDLVEALRQVAKAGAFWLAQEEPALHEGVSALLEGAEPVPFAFSDCRDLALVFGRIIDAKSAFTRRHSQGVADLARWLGARMGLEADALDDLELAGLFHDIGKLRVPDAILEKPGPLTAAERTTVMRHPFDTWWILHRLFGWNRMVPWAALHHESLNGQGYPFRRRGDELPVGARVVAVADIFQALAQCRPYRRALSPQRIASTLGEMVREGRLDGGIVSSLVANLEECWRVAMQAEGGGAIRA